ncbi:MAG TPA: AmmeMemoRadiSam system protein B [Nitrososphaerales archaeon]|nr:AmmeMemoRadiSam system protein B [Nitrososphaerales archaeon]
MKLRRPAVAGSFYPANREDLLFMLNKCYVHPLGPGRAPPAPPGNQEIIAVVAPHAAYEYSGPIAAHSYLHVSTLRDPDLIVVLAPNHYGLGSGISTFKEGEWETPLGRMRVDEAAAFELVRDSGIVTYDAEANRMEHSLEVQLPFLQQIYGDSVPFLPVSLIFQDVETAKTLGSSLSAIVKGKKAVLIASSDLTHYEPRLRAMVKDSALLEAVRRLSLEGFYSTLDRLQVTACGYGAIATVMEASRSLGLKCGELLKYATSGDTTGDNNQVVGYGALRFV